MVFSKDFKWGVATSSYQIEGRGKKEDDIWDLYCLATNKIFNHDDAIIATDHLNKFKEDVDIMKSLNINSYRFSISWSRIIDTKTNKVRKEGIAFYHNLIDYLLENNIEPFITLYHWDMPNSLLRKGGFLNKEIVNDFSYFAKIVSKEFSSKVKYFITLNEPQCFCGLGYVDAVHAPGWKVNKSDALHLFHNSLLCHGAMVKSLRDNSKQELIIGYAPTSTPIIPKDNSEKEIKKAYEKYFEINDINQEQWYWNVSLFSDAVILGDYPKDYYEKYKDYLPEITKEDLKLINQKIDFLGQNIYYGVTKTTANQKHSDMQWPIVPESLYWGPKFLYKRYKLPIIITENGIATIDSISKDGKIHDQSRIDFIQEYLEQLERAVDDNVDIQGYFHWSLLDNFEWTFGYSKRFGLVHVDFQTLKRTVKESGLYYSKIIKSHT